MLRGCLTVLLLTEDIQARPPTTAAAAAYGGPPCPLTQRRRAAVLRSLSATRSALQLPLPGRSSHPCRLPLPVPSQGATHSARQRSVEEYLEALAYSACVAKTCCMVLEQQAATFNAAEVEPIHPLTLYNRVLC